MTTNVLKGLKNKNEREKMFRKLEKSERVILKKFFEKLPRAMKKMQILMWSIKFKHFYYRVNAKPLYFFY